MKVAITPKSTTFSPIIPNMVQPTKEELEAKEAIQLAGMVSAFIMRLKTIRPNAKRHLFYNAYNPNYADTALLRRVRQEAISFKMELDAKKELHGIICSDTERAANE